MVEQRLPAPADAFAAMLRPDDDVRYPRIHCAVARGAGEADLPPPVNQRDCTDRIFEGAPVDLIRARCRPNRSPSAASRWPGSRGAIGSKLISRSVMAVRQMISAAKVMISSGLARTKDWHLHAQGQFRALLLREGRPWRRLRLRRACHANPGPGRSGQSSCVRPLCGRAYWRRPWAGFKARPGEWWRAAGRSSSTKALSPVTEPVGDRIAAVAAEILLGDLHARRRLPALVFGDVEQMLDARAPSPRSWPRATISSTPISFSTRHSRMSSSTG